jgi:antagonist of KipI
MRDGARTYLAVQDGFDVPLVMGSASTFVVGQFGGFHGRRLQSGDVLRLRRQKAARVRSLRLGALDRLRAPQALRVAPGAQHDWFGPQALETLFSTAYRLTEQADRRGLRLQGAFLRDDRGADLLSEGVPLGAVQVPPDGQPIILFVDQQTTGGYPKIANVIAADRHRVGQLRPRDEVRFAEVSIAQAIEILAEQERWLKQLLLA